MKTLVLMIWSLLIGGMTGWFVTYSVYQYIQKEASLSVEGKKDRGAGSDSSQHKKRRVVVDSRSAVPNIELLRSLGYVDGIVDDNYKAADVLVYDPQRAQPGYNLYSSRKQHGAYIIDMKGKIVHSWELLQYGTWQHIQLLSNGDVLVIVKDKRLMRVDKNSELIWVLDGRYHHDLWVVGQEIFTLTRELEIVPYIHPKYPTLVDKIVVVSMEGKRLREYSILEIIHRSVHRYLLPSISHVELGDADGLRNELDVLHSNHVEVFDGSQAERGPLYKAGNLLISLRNINVIAILDGDTHDIRWIWGPSNISLQHDPTLLENGNILVFDNGTSHSRVLEIDPLTNQIVWQYGPHKDFFSKTRGSNQRLANGNTLITESDKGYVHEVTKEGEVVWQFANPRIDDKRMREAVWRMTRFDPKDYPFLKK